MERRSSSGPANRGWAASCRSDSRTQMGWFSIRPRALAGRGAGSAYRGHETTNQLSGTLTTTSIRQPPPAPPTCGKLDTNAPHQNAQRQNTLCRNAHIRRYIARNILRRPAVHRCPRAPPPSNRPSATGKKTTKQTQSRHTHSKSTTCRPRISEDPWRQSRFGDPWLFLPQRAIDPLAPTQPRPPAKSQPQPQPQSARIELPNKPNLTRSRDFPPNKSTT